MTYLKDSKHIYFIGIGGIGISAIARMLLLEGKQVTGSDQGESPVTEELRKAGATVFIGHKAEQIPTDTDLIIRSNAIGETNPEYQHALTSGITMITYPEALGEISENKFTIAIAGTHGKTTTTAMIARIAIDAQLDPSVIVGSLFKDSKTNFIAGNSKYLIVEADEYKRSFTHLSPDIIAINNIGLDHIDYYKDLEDVKSAFRELLAKAKPGARVVGDMSDEIVREVATSSGLETIDTNSISYSCLPNLLIPGAHNRHNARTAYGVATALDIEPEKICASLGAFDGVWRRFEYKGVSATGAIIYDDYAHNPDKVKAALQGAFEAFPNKKIVFVFQPHLYSRTKAFLDEFAANLAPAHEIVLLPIYAAREALDTSITSEDLNNKIQICGNPFTHCVATIDEAVAYLKDKGEEYVIMTVGAGDVYKVGEKLVI
ncbi:MAG: UDP-N-acetylmuramate--L-alanine ligase, UDP-N-acetylmuramate--alanine ligase [Candidatus Parcubacteria bacterium]|jgi:UDP-N-acetylmuramate--alanine ligase